MSSKKTKNETASPVRKIDLVKMKLLMKSNVSGLKLSGVIDELFPLFLLIGLSIISYFMTIILICIDMNVSFSEFIEKIPSIIEYMQHPVSLEEYINNQYSY